MKKLPQSALLNNPVFPWQVERFTRVGRLPALLEVTPEATLVIAVNGMEIAAMPRTPGADLEMAVGFVVSEGYVQGFDAITETRYTPVSGQNGNTSAERVDLTAEASALRLEAGRGLLRLYHPSRTGFDVALLQKNDDLLSPLPLPGWCVNGEKLLEMAETLRANQVNYERTRGIHASALFDASARMLVMYEDISRHNTVDKVLGWALLNRVPLSECLLLTTGRAGHKMVLKAVRVGLPVLASRSSPSSVAIQLAQALNLTLVGYLAGDQGNLYTHGSRLLFQ